MISSGVLDDDGSNIVATLYICMSDNITTPIPRQVNIFMASKYKKFKQGPFYPKYPEKCLNKPGEVVYRSKLELDFMMMCERNPNVFKWASEKIVVPYYNSGKGRDARYFVDFFVELTDGRRFLFEVKPYKEASVIRDPSLLAKRMAKSKAKKSTLLIEAFNATQNREKWEAAISYARKYTTDAHPLVFMVITERDLDTIWTTKVKVATTN